MAEATRAPRDHAGGGPAMDLVHLAVLASSDDTRIELCRVASGIYEGVPVAVKRLDESPPPAALAALRDETWFAATVDHPHVVRVVSWGEDESGPFIAMEFVHGVSLARLARTVFRTGEHFHDRLLAYLAAKLGAGLAAIHGMRDAQEKPLHIVHGNLAPENLLVGFEGEVKIGDFGFAHAGSTPRTVEGMLPEPAYMAPERLRGEASAASADVFSLGVVLYELMAQHRPRRGRSVAELVAEHERIEAFDVRVGAPKAGDMWVDLVNRCLRLDPSMRPTAAEIEAQLGDWLMRNAWDDGGDHLGRYVRRNALKQSRWLERALRGELDGAEPAGREVFESSRDLSSAPEPASPQEPSPEPAPEPPAPRAPMEATRVEQSAQAAMGKGKPPFSTPEVATIVDEETALDAPIDGRILEEEERLVDRLRTLVPAAEAAARAARMASAGADAAAAKVEVILSRLEKMERARALLATGDRVEAEVAFGEALNDDG